MALVVRGPCHRPWSLSSSIAVVIVVVRCRVVVIVRCHPLSRSLVDELSWVVGQPGMWLWAVVDSGGGASLTFNRAGGLPSAFVDGHCWIRVVVVGGVGARRGWCWTGSRHSDPMGARERLSALVAARDGHGR